MKTLIELKYVVYKYAKDFSGVISPNSTKLETLRAPMYIVFDISISNIITFRHISLYERKEARKLFLKKCFKLNIKYPAPEEQEVRRKSEEK